HDRGARCRLAEARGQRRRQVGSPDAAPVRAAPSVRFERGEAAHAPHAAAGGLGAGLRRSRKPLARERLAATAEDRAGPRTASLSPHRARSRLPAGRSDPAPFVNIYRFSAGEPRSPSCGLQASARSVDLMFDLAAIGIALACFAFIYLLLFVLERV